MKQIHQNQEFRFNEVLFEHRNKDYGAYVLRNESDRILTKALFIGVSLLAAVSITPFVISAFKSDVPSKGPEGVEIEFVDPVIPDVPATPPAQVLPPKATPPPSVKQFDSTVPEPSSTAPDDTSKKEPIPDDAVAGFKNDFTAEPVKRGPEPINLEGTGKGPVLPYVPQGPPTPKVPDDRIVTGPELASEAAFEGGINAFRNKVTSNFDGSSFDGSGETMRTVVTFVVETNGTISGMKAEGGDADFNREALRTIKSVKGKWKPGLNKNGDAVRSYFKFPISMKFE
ncbi:energy transducer TonB [Chryseobacterium sp. 2987]|uniref:energy transducer TonB n=1 Tax=Chryseobacterium sp. 2987 TaxID=2817767 RepID=UPI00285EC8BB|nr:energy transducer TonB [Chryseobacterium sp. 2987]MDR6920805.1 protein TonB [Chryseobacterium sp. 2987]